MVKKRVISKNTDNNRASKNYKDNDNQTQGHMGHIELPKKRIIEVQANIFKRLGAFILDLIILDFIISPFTSVIESSFSGVSFSEIQSYLNANASLSSSMILMTVMIGLISLLYFAVLEYKFGQTIGKMIFRIHVKSENPELRFSQCVIRSLFIIPTIPFVFFMIIDPIYFVFSKSNKRLLEKWSYTKTVDYIDIG